MRRIFAIAAMFALAAPTMATAQAPAEGRGHPPQGPPLMALLFMALLFMALLFMVLLFMVLLFMALLALLALLFIAQFMWAARLWAMGRMCSTAILMPGILFISRAHGSIRPVMTIACGLWARSCRRCSGPPRLIIIPAGTRWDCRRPIRASSISNTDRTCSW
jgi:hypothetical protein